MIEWTLIDRGETGVDDWASITIRSGDDASIVLAAAGDITRGNLQARKNSEP